MSSAATETAPAAPSKTVKAPKAAKVAKAPKAAKVAKAPKAAPSHPTYSDMIKKAVVELKEKTGSSKPAILKFLLANYKLGENVVQINAHLRTALKRGVTSGALKQTKGTGASGSFKLGEKKVAAPKPKAAAKPKVAKKAAAEKKPKSPKKKAAPKPKKAAAPAAEKKAKAPKKTVAKKAKTASPKKTKVAAKPKVAKKAAAPKKA